ncbi:MULTISPECIES: hypothetical protein [Methylobacterium]|uniref:hypothetical protein n=1 Tax=Methylobacterium TaxID=407 RepID=UPI001043F87F|nr:MULTISPECIES: hypothetical protein [Methylobacterium]MDR7039671.1 hypothetical protein [Methylobacterium sp. BE186]
MSDLDGKRAEITARIAKEFGLGDPASLPGEDLARIEAATEAVLEADAVPPASPDLRRLIAEYRALQELRADEDNARLAEKGEVFAPENDA